MLFVFVVVYVDWSPVRPILMSSVYGEKIQEYLRDRGLPTTGNKEELVGLTFSASYFFILN